MNEVTSSCEVDAAGADELSVIPQSMSSTCTYKLKKLTDFPRVYTFLSTTSTNVSPFKEIL
jgi:hypothetical protein